MKSVLVIILVSLISVFATADEPAPLLPHQKGECTNQVIEDFSVVVRYCETAQFSAKNNEVCLALIDEFLKTYPGVNCQISRKSASGLSLEPYVLSESMLLNTRQQLNALFN